MKVSVITAFYKGNKYMPSYVKCMLANAAYLQGAGHELEVILVNDSPADKVMLVNDSQTRQLIKVINQSQNTGIHGARVAGLKHATGDYIMFLDQDDLLADDALLQHVNCILEWQNKLDEINKNMSQELQQTETIQKMYNPVSVSNASLEQADGNSLTWYRTDYHKRQIGNLQTYLKVGNQIISPGQCLIPRQFVPRIWTERICKENGSDDYYLWLVMLGLRHHFILVDEELYTHKFTGANISADTTNTDVSTYEFVDFLRDTDYLSSGDINKLLRMNKYKANFRASNKFMKIILSICNMDIFLANVFYKIKTKTPVGFNR
ncbi:MAG: glycosyltransferase [Lachnospiraceae bacterium]|nr:glycosyltransferase [Lachnospiraceae bacterium]